MVKSLTPEMQIGYFNSFLKTHYNRQFIYDFSIIPANLENHFKHCRVIEMASFKEVYTLIKKLTLPDKSNAERIEKLKDLIKRHKIEDKEPLYLHLIKYYLY